MCTRARVCGGGGGGEGGVGAQARACACARVALLIQQAAGRNSHLRSLLLPHRFRPCIINGTMFGKKVLDTKCVF